MARLSEEGLIAIHNIIEQKYPLKLKGIKSRDKIKEIVQRPDLKVYGYQPFSSIFTKASALMEGIIRGHAFYDGNKRTGLMATFAYLQREGYYLVLPIDVVRYAVQIASNQNNDEESINKLIIEIARWLEKRSATTYLGYVRKALRYTVLPAIGLLIINSVGFRKYADKKISEWYQLEFHKDYVGTEASTTSNIIKNSIADSVKAMTKKNKKKHT